MSNSKKVQDYINKFKSNLGKYLNASESKQVGYLIIKFIKQRSRSGKDINGQKFDGLSGPYKDYRQRYKKNLHETTTPKKSNITATGQMLDSMKSEGKAGQIVVNGPSGRRAKELDGKSRGGNNKDVARYVTEQGREFFGLTTEEKSRLIKEVKKTILSNLKK